MTQISPPQCVQNTSSAEDTPTFQSIENLLDSPPGVKLQSLQHQAEIAPLLAREILEEEVESLACEHHSRDRPSGREFYRWSSNPASIRIDGEGVSNDVPGVRDVDAGKKRPLESYQAMKKADVPNDLLEAILLGLAENDFERGLSSQTATLCVVDGSKDLHTNLEHINRKELALFRKA